ncbi:hypothetical protein GCM10010149_53350 [Nonomuraea roseoviolacea subsp. roseoviolacea]
MTAVKVPRGMPTDTSRRAATAPRPFPYTLLTVSNRTASLTVSNRTASVMAPSLPTCGFGHQRATHDPAMTSS